MSAPKYGSKRLTSAKMKARYSKDAEIKKNNENGEINDNPYDQNYGALENQYEIPK